MSDKKKKKFWKKAKEILSFIAAFGVVVVGTGFFMDMRNGINLLTEKLDSQSDKVDTMYNYVYIDDNNINAQLTSINQNISNLQGQLDTINAALNIKIIAVTEETTITTVDEVTMESHSGSYVLPTLFAEMTVGTDSQGVLYYAEDLINETILLTYKEGGKEVYFLGQFNEKYHWDGYCVTNSYNADGTLHGICESQFDDGVRLDYKSLYMSEKNKWILSNRICEKDKNVGTTTEYSFNYKDIKNFTDTNVRSTDILYVDGLLSDMSATITQFYCGETINQRFNDDSGDAYLVKYDLDGAVKTLYMGNFVDGYCEDTTGNGWSIAYSDELENYFYNTGDFKGNKALDKSTTAITVEEIEQIVSGYSFDCELKWKNK